MKGQREYRNTQQNVVFMPRAAVDLSRGGCPEPTRNGCSRATDDGLVDVLTGGQRHPRLVQLLPRGSNIDQLLIPVQENRRGAEFITSLLYREPQEHHGADAMSVDSDGMSIVSSDSDEMDCTEFMDYVDGVGDLVERFTRLKLGVDFFESFFANTALDEKGRVVRRSPRLGGATGSFFVPSSDGRTLRRRSARTRQK